MTQKPPTKPLPAARRPFGQATAAAPVLARPAALGSYQAIRARLTELVEPQNRS